MNEISFEDLPSLALGAAVLGSGGGGNPCYDLMIASQRLSVSGSVKLVQLQDLDDDAFVVPVAFMGAPLVGVEKLSSGRELPALIEAIENECGKKVTHLVSAEIGGANAFTPIAPASLLGLPVLDADCLGRAFPELQMCSCNVYGINPAPAFLSDARGRTVKIMAKDAAEMEKCCRDVTMDMGSSAALAMYLMTGKEAKKALISGSVSRAVAIGRILTESNGNFLRDLVRVTGGKVLARGVISDVNQRIDHGFLNGTFVISREDDDDIVVHYQNEYLAVYSGKIPLACSPDIIIPIEEENGIPVTSETLGFGQRVILIGIPSPALWTTEEGLKLVGPEYFGYKINYEEVKI